MVILIYGLLMVKQSSFNILKSAKLYLMYSLAFLVLLFFSHCHRPEDQSEIIWENNRAIGILIPKNGRDLDSIKVTRSTVNGRQISGSFINKYRKIEFRSTIPLTAGLTYDIWNGKQRIGSIGIPYPNRDEEPELIAIFPVRDTVPENLLKFYFYFSKRMRTGQALEHIFLLDKNNDTVRNVFLNLQPELWDSTGRVLTVWLDPGRIKRELVLNKKLGNPLNRNARYLLVVNDPWHDTYGLTITQRYTKSFAVGAADHEMPDVKKWSLILPKAGSKGKLIIDAKEPLDHFLFAESITVVDSKDATIKGKVTIKKDQFWEFTPIHPWTAQSYELKVNARLEDLAANNLNKVFDRDMSKEKAKNDEVVRRTFILKR